MSPPVSSNADVLIVGGGIIGLSCAWSLLKAGRSVTILEREHLGSGSSHGNCGTLTPSHAPPLAAPGLIPQALRWMLQPDAPFHVSPRWDPALLAWLRRFAARCNARDYETVLKVKARLLQRSRVLIEQRVREEGLDCEFEPGGTLYVYRTAQARDQGAAMALRLQREGIAVDLLDGAAARALEPALNDSVIAGHRYPGDASLRPDRFLAEMARVVRALGADIHEHSPVSGFVTAGGRIESVVTPRGAWLARDTLLAAGAWSPQVVRDLQLRLPIQPGKGYSITYSRPALAPRIPLVLRERSVCVTAWTGGFRLGSTMEFSGYDESLNRTRLDALPRAAREYLREPVGAQKISEWYGWRPMTYDDLPILGGAPGYDNLWVAAGHGMLGVTLSAVTGELMAQMMTGASTSLDVAPFAPNRFS